MNITFLLGNGFDVGLGLKSSFSDFFPKYIQDSRNKSASLSALAKDIESNVGEWSYFEKKMGEYTIKFTKESVDDYKNQFNDFEISFMKYLQEEESRLVYNKEKILQVFKSALLNFYTTGTLPVGSFSEIDRLISRHSSEDYDYNFLTFNYTATLENCLSTFPKGIILERSSAYRKCVNKIGKIVHVHGTRTNLPIMGVNDVSQIKNEELAKDSRFTKLIVKPLNNKANRTNNDFNAMNLISSSHIICVYGMSLGETDKKWWIAILKWLEENPNCQLVIYNYDENYTLSSQFYRIDKEDSIIELLSSYYSPKKFDMETLRERIHIAIHKNIFSVNLRKDDELIIDEVAASQVSP